MDFENWLRTPADEGGSDLYLTTGAPPSAKFDGELKPLSDERLSPGFTRDLAYELMDGQQAREFDEKLEMNLAISLPGVGRFRVNIFKQRNEVGMVVRYIVVDIPPMQQLGLPSIAADLIKRRRGLLLVVGATGSGKSTTLASLIDHRNSNMGGHIVTIEDPVEFIHRHKRSIVNQRELGVDTRSWENALKNTLRQAPDVIYIGEIRDRATMEYAVSFAETGHLCVSTLHASNANQALERIVNFFPEERRPQLLMDLSLNLLGIMSQRLIPTAEGGRCAAIEVLLASPLVKDLILQGDI
ncbi:MAG: PilT/PilU family type 4a pilus ATPase, partial [Pseudomonadota bacterium]|nr:PilT/PilU family type 4a pilus ATPase [Pseudomonadota bacterium]